MTAPLMGVALKATLGPVPRSILIFTIHMLEIPWKVWVSVQG